MTPEQAYQQKVEQGRRERKAFREKNSLCPHCGGDGLRALGGLDEAFRSEWLPPLWEGAP